MIIDLYTGHHDSIKTVESAVADPGNNLSGGGRGGIKIH